MATKISWLFWGPTWIGPGCPRTVPVTTPWVASEWLLDLLRHGQDPISQQERNSKAQQACHDLETPVAGLQRIGGETEKLRIFLKKMCKNLKQKIHFKAILGKPLILKLNGLRLFDL